MTSEAAPPRTLSKSDFALARTCDAKLYFRENRYPDNGESDPYIRLLREGSYMVEALATAKRAGGILLEYGRNPVEDFERTREYLSRDNVTLFRLMLQPAIMAHSPHHRFPTLGVNMFVRTRRPIASLCIALLALNVVACTHIKRQEAQTVIQPGGGSVTMKKIVGVTLKDGRDIRFDENSRPVVRGDSLQAEVGKQPLAIPVSDLQRVWVQSISKTRTTLLIIGIALAVDIIRGLASIDPLNPQP